MFDALARETINTSGAEINLVHGGSGPPVLLLHGSPQTHTVWHELAPILAESHTVVAADLRGYGDSSKPVGGGDHSHWFFLPLPEPIPEQMIEPTAISFLHLLLGGLGSGLDVYAPEVLAEYERCFAVPAAIHGMCEDYRAAASIDLVHDGA
jgi:pimeloyl-ACP methyl ester carboxylesterase